MIAVEPSSGERVYLCAFSGEDGTHSWLALDDAGAPVREPHADSGRGLDRGARRGRGGKRGSTRGLEPRLASPSYLDSLGAGAAGDVAGALQGALPAIDELTRDLELNYKLELE